MSDSNPPTILIVDDTLANLRLLAQLLMNEQYEVRPVTNGKAALAAALAAPPNLILLDIRMPDLDGYAVCAQLKANSATRAIPIIFLSALNDTQDKLKAFHAGGVDYITKPFHPEEVLARVRTHLALEKVRAELEIANHELKNALAREEVLARTDWLTGLLNRSHFFTLSVYEFTNAVRYQHPLTLIMFDIDHFKRVNDQFGHPAGDVVLKQIAQTAANQCRNADILGRYGGEEFIALLPMTNLPQALFVAERIMEEIRALRVETDNGVVQVTISMGIAQRWTNDESIERMIDRADQALYTAKRGGRNCIVCASSI